MKTKIAIISNNYSNCDFPTEWGLSIYVEHGGKKMLVDTGCSDMFMRNAQQMNIDLGAVDYIILTHRHFDHVDGMRLFPFSGQKIFVHEDFFGDFYKFIAGNYKSDKVEWDRSKLNGEHTFIFNDAFTQVCNGIYLSGTVPRPYGTPKNHYFKKDGDDYLPDIVSDEQFVILEQPDGLIIISGCTHFGIENMTVLIRDRFPNKKVKALFAGLHTGLQDGSDVEKVIRHLDECGLYQRVYALHCTGEEVGMAIEKKLGGRHVFVGEVFEL